MPKIPTKAPDALFSIFSLYLLFLWTKILYRLFKTKVLRRNSMLALYYSYGLCVATLYLSVCLSVLISTDIARRAGRSAAQGHYP